MSGIEFTTALGLKPQHIVAAQMLDDLNRSADAVSAALRFPSGSAFRNTCQRYLGATPHEIRDRGGAAWAAGRFLQELGKARGG